jgi:hypothetical protein
LDMHATEEVAQRVRRVHQIYPGFVLDYSFESNPLARPFLKLPAPAYYACGAAFTTGLNWLGYRMARSKQFHKVWWLPQALSVAGNAHGYSTYQWTTISGAACPASGFGLKHLEAGESRRFHQVGGQKISKFLNLAIGQSRTIGLSEYSYKGHLRHVAGGQMFVHKTKRNAACAERKFGWKSTGMVSKEQVIRFSIGPGNHRETFG